MRNYLFLRVRVLGRLLRELGWWRLLVLGALLTLAGARALVVAASSPFLAWGVPLVVAAMVLGLHRPRPDLTFLQLTAPNFRRWLATEYALLSVLPALFLLVWGRLAPAALTVVLAAAVALVPPATARASRTHQPSLFRSTAFEWVSGGRRVGLGLAWLGLLAVAATTRHTATGPALAVVGWLLLLLDIYGPAEPQTWLLPVLRTPGQWLRNRIGGGCCTSG
ncbi:hypothetical protein [Hymenobacter glacieicola]|nr:hypothetical protein [Hymenobacter glacieicola]